MSNPFIQRVANWLAQEVVVKGLAENKTFQRFALRTDAHVKELTKKVPNPTELAKSVDSFAKNVSETVAKEMKATPEQVGFKSKQELLAEARAKQAAK